MLEQRLVIPSSAPLECIFPKVIIGTALEFSLYFEDELTPGSPTPMDFTDLELISELRLTPFSDPITGDPLTATERVGEPGWVDFLLKASASAGRTSDANLHWLFKVLPNGDTDRLRPVLSGTIPVRAA